MVKTCAAFNCKQRFTTNGAVSFHRFPVRDFDVFTQWIVAVRRKNWFPSKSSYLCSRHFKADDYRIYAHNNRRTLKPNAIPSIFDFSEENPRHTKQRSETDVSGDLNTADNELFRSGSQETVSGDGKKERTVFIEYLKQKTEIDEHLTQDAKDNFMEEIKFVDLNMQNCEMMTPNINDIKVEDQLMLNDDEEFQKKFADENSVCQQLDFSSLSSASNHVFSEKPIRKIKSEKADKTSFHFAGKRTKIENLRVERYASQNEQLKKQVIFLQDKIKTLERKLAQKDEKIKDLNSFLNIIQEIHNS